MPPWLALVDHWLPWPTWVVGGTTALAVAGQAAEGIPLDKILAQSPIAATTLVIVFIFAKFLREERDAAAGERKEAREAHSQAMTEERKLEREARRDDNNALAEAIEKLTGKLEGPK